MGSKSASSDGEVLAPPFGIEQEIGYKPKITGAQTLPQNRSGKNHGSNTPMTEIPGNPILINQSTSEYLYSQLSVSPLNDIYNYLWWPAIPGPHHTRLLYYQQLEYMYHERITQPDKIHPFHQQLAMGREIMITEDPCLHLTWCDSFIYIKPLPLYLLKWKFFNESICPNKELYGYAAGLLFTYIYLVRSQSDFRIAVGEGLIPGEVTWTAWSSLATSLASMRQENISKRYNYGELQLWKINLVFLFWGGSMPYRFFSRGDRWYVKYFTLCILVFVYFSVVLSAMQLALATSVDVAVTFKTTSYGLGAFVTISILVSVGVVVGLRVVYLLVVSLVATRNWYLILRRKWR